jgi:hypothetical protein
MGARERIAELVNEELERQMKDPDSPLSKLIAEKLQAGAKEDKREDAGVKEITRHRQSIGASGGPLMPRLKPPGYGECR